MLARNLEQKISKPNIPKNGTVSDKMRPRATTGNIFSSEFIVFEFS